MFFFVLLSLYLIRKLFTWTAIDMTVTTPSPPRPDNTRPQNPYGAPINIPPPVRQAP